MRKAEKSEPITIKTINKFFTEVLSTAVDLIDEHFFDNEIKVCLVKINAVFQLVKQMHYYRW